MLIPKKAWPEARVSLDLAFGPDPDPDPALGQWVAQENSALEMNSEMRLLWLRDL